MERKTRSLFLVLEFLALTVAGILILIDYKLKKDLLALFARIEKAAENAQESGRGAANGGNDTASVHRGNMVADPPGMEAATSTPKANANGAAATAARNRPSPKRNRGNGNTQVPEPDKQVGA